MRSSVIADERPGFQPVAAYCSYFARRPRDRGVGSSPPASVPVRGQPVPPQPREPCPVLVPAIDEHRDPGVSEDVTHPCEAHGVVAPLWLVVDRRVEDRPLQLESEADRYEPRSPLRRGRRQDGPSGGPEERSLSGREHGLGRHRRRHGPMPQARWLLAFAVIALGAFALVIAALGARNPGWCPAWIIEPRPMARTRARPAVPVSRQQRPRHPRQALRRPRRLPSPSTLDPCPDRTAARDGRPAARLRRVPAARQRRQVGGRWPEQHARRGCRSRGHGRRTHRGRGHPRLRGSRARLVASASTGRLLRRSTRIGEHDARGVRHGGRTIRRLDRGR